MRQIILNYICLILIPMMAGFLLRFLFRHSKKAYLISLCLTVLSAAAWIAAYTIPSHGSERYFVYALMITSAATASLLTGVIICLKRRK